MPHCPSLPQVCWCVVSLHFVVPGLQTPPQRLPTQVYGHVWAVPHWPPLPQVSSEPVAVVEHRVALGVHVPPHAPLWHTMSQGVSLIQLPDVSQRCGVFSLHWRSFGEHAPLLSPTMPPSV